LKNIHLTVDHASAMNCDWMTHPGWTLVPLPQAPGEKHQERRRGICAAKDPSVCQSDRRRSAGIAAPGQQ
jgi:hypothetical protein